MPGPRPERSFLINPESPSKTALTCLRVRPVSSDRLLKISVLVRAFPAMIFFAVAILVGPPWAGPARETAPAKPGTRNCHSFRADHVLRFSPSAARRVPHFAFALAHHVHGRNFSHAGADSSSGSPQKMPVFIGFWGCGRLLEHESQPRSAAGRAVFAVQDADPRARPAAVHAGRAQFQPLFPVGIVHCPLPKRLAPSGSERPRRRAARGRTFRSPGSPTLPNEHRVRETENTPAELRARRGRFTPSGRLREPGRRFSIRGYTWVAVDRYD